MNKREKKMAAGGLRRTASILRDGGWTQGEFKDEHGQHCLVGALNVAGTDLGNDKASLIARNFLQEVYLPRISKYGDDEVDLVEWNDRLPPDTGRRTVLTMLARAANRLERP